MLLQEFAIGLMNSVLKQRCFLWVRLNRGSSLLRILTDFLVILPSSLQGTRLYTLCRVYSLVP